MVCELWNILTKNSKFIFVMINSRICLENKIKLSTNCPHKSLNI
jgi:hypothetical protein